MNSYPQSFSFIQPWFDLDLDQLYELLSNYYDIDEDAYLNQLINVAEPTKDELLAIISIAKPLIEETRTSGSGVHIVDQLLQEYSLSDEDGITLMCLAESLLRVPDTETRNALIRDKLTAADWEKHLDSDNELFVNVSTWGLLIAGRFVKSGEVSNGNLINGLSHLLYQCGAPTLRGAMNVAMKVIGEYFVLGRTIDEAGQRSKPFRQLGCQYSFDMLGEAAHTRADAQHYFANYMLALDTLAKNTDSSSQPSLSIKISALHPRYEESQRQYALEELTQTVLLLANKARHYGIAITIDAEEADRLELSLALFKRVYESTKGWGGFGLVVQAYSKRALPVLCWITLLAKSQGDEIPVRLVKGAYWDAEIKHCQEMGTKNYPVFTRKESTDTSYLACARYMLSNDTIGCIYPQFASHNAHTIASVLVMAGERSFELQRLHGMGEGLYETLLRNDTNLKVRIYAPVGSHEDLLPYLVRRLLENGANGSFVHKLQDSKVPVDELIVHPVTQLLSRQSLSNPMIPVPPFIFNGRVNAMGINMNIASQRLPFLHDVCHFQNARWLAKPIVGIANNDVINSGVANSEIAEQYIDEIVHIGSPYQHDYIVGSVSFANAELAKHALKTAQVSFPSWALTPVDERANVLENTASLLEENRAELVALCVQEAGKTLQDSIDEVREAVDFCRYYAQQGRRICGKPQVLSGAAGRASVGGPTGESNELHYEARGVFVCISPWNYPLAIFIGQVAAALVAGNTVIAKPSAQTSLIAFKAIEYFHQSGAPTNVLQFLPGRGAALGDVLTQHNAVDGVAFTGSTQTARHININLANRKSSIASLIAETGGLNAMLVDSTALPEQVATDVIRSAFSAAGQRCSALRVLYVQHDIAERVIELIKGSMDELVVGKPNQYSTDVGPVIDGHSQQQLLSYIDDMKSTAKQYYQSTLPKNSAEGFFVPPTLFEINSMSELCDEKFGPILHVVRFNADELTPVIDDINRTGFGLTLGIHSRNTNTYTYIAKHARVGNVYINRNQVGAVVGVNPFGGRGLSGTGPKAGGPNYLLRFMTEKTISLNTAAIGGNADLLSPEK